MWVERNRTDLFESVLPQKPHDDDDDDDVHLPTFLKNDKKTTFFDLLMTLATNFEALDTPEKKLRGGR